MYSCDNPLTKPYGYFKTRKCVPNTPTHVFKINEPSSLCPNWDMQSWQTTFDTCTHCGEGESAGSPGSGSTCWLPYSKDAAGKCFAYDAQNVGWWKVGPSSAREEEAIQEECAGAVAWGGVHRVAFVGVLLGVGA